MSATPPFGPAYEQPPDEPPRRQGPNQWQPQAGRPPAGQGGPGQPPPGGQRPQAGRPGPAAGGRPQAGSPAAGRGPARPQYQSPQTGGMPQSPPPPYGPQPQQPPQVDAEELSPEPFEEAAFGAGSQGDWSGEATSTIGRLGAAKESRSRRRTDFQKKRRRARKSSPIPKIIAAVAVLGLLGAAGWWWLNRDDSGDETDTVDPSLAYAPSEEPCSLADSSPLDGLVDGVEPEAVAEAEQRRRGWEQSCVLTYGEPDSAAALLEYEGTVFDSDAKASVNFELGAREVAEMTDPWTVIEPAPELGAQAAAVARVVEEGTSNYQLHLQDGNVYLVVRLSVVDSGMDEQGMTDLATELAGSYLDAWDDAG
ncbi:hypothetical protein [Glycomyces xiaoerkulensis]|uniref:hypothetical protein n=1 Tax=Glycomyces xiaoerkulensis TaxID=2038139 RepID=UPI0012FFF259|nr:hypothetical protein [Glycomyces xiaoerkulensis]